MNGTSVTSVRVPGRWHRAWTDLLGSERGRVVLALVLLGINVALLLAYLFISYRGIFHSDSAVKNLLAQEMRDTASFFPPDWNYVNKDLMVLFGQLGIFALLPFFENSYTLYAAASSVTALLILASAFWFTGLLDAPAWQRVLAVAVLAGGISGGIAEDVFGQAAYGAVLMFTCLVAVLAWKILSTPTPRRLLWCALLLALTTLVTWSNPQRAAASYLLPLLCGLAGYAYGREWRQRLRGAVAVLVPTLAGFVLGMALSARTLAQVNNTVGAGAARWLSFDGMAANVVHTGHSMIGLLGGLPASGGSVTSVAGLYAAIRLLAALLLLLLIGRRIVAMCASPGPRTRFAGALLAGLSLCFLCLQATTTIADINDPVSAARYLTPMLVLGVMALACTPLDASAPLRSLLVVCLSLLLATSSLVVFNPGSLINPDWRNPRRDALVADLNALGLRYGYANYWNAGSLTVLSGGRTTLRPIMIAGGLPIPMRHLSSDRWYEPEAWQGETFLLLNDADRAAIDWGAMSRHVGAPVHESRLGDLHLYVFNDNLSHRLPNWSNALTSPMRISAGPDSAKTVGRWVPADSALHSGVGESGYLQYGPYRPLRRGNYQVTYEIDGSAAPAGQVVAVVDVAEAGGTGILGSMEVRAGAPGHPTILFSLDHPVTDLELRVLATGNGELAYKGLTVSAQRRSVHCKSAAPERSTGDWRSGRHCAADSVTP